MFYIDYTNDNKNNIKFMSAKKYSLQQFICSIQFIYKIKFM